MNKFSRYDLPIKFESKSHEALISIWWTAIMINKESRKLFKKFNISEAQFNLMMILKYSSGPLTQNDLSARMLVDKSNITGLVDSLERIKHIKRNQVEKDRRRYHITLTKKGKKFIDIIAHIYEKKVADIMRLFNAEESEQLIQLTKKIRKVLVKLR